ncbi:hypothetical protein P8605_18590, partial [Streptomyces sp. T-3]|nr:hypothetical protein [Streptomyces sp. T-3]
VAASRLPDGRAAIEVVEHRGGIGWAAPRLLELIERHRPAAVVIDPHGPARPVWSRLTETRGAYVPMLDFGVAELVASHTELLDGLVSRQVAHRSHERLDAAVSAATTRVVREVEVMSRTVAADGTSPAAVIAGMLALYGLEHPPEQQRPTLRVARS